jgi:hypothetical protein
LPPRKGLAALAGAAFHDQDKITYKVAQHLLRTQETGDYVDRGIGGIHPSEAAHDGWCPRSSYYRLVGTPIDPVPRALAMEIVYSIGEESGKKWQNWLWEMGLIRGLWLCHACDLWWEDTSPRECPRCEAGMNLLEYKEVPAFNKEHLLIGSADGDIFNNDRWVLMENKTIGAGTVRIEAPALFAQYGEDYYKLWQNIRRPFASHLRQGMIYCFCMGRKEIVYIYEPKFITAWPKEWEIKFLPSIVEDILDKCLIVRKAIDVGRPPKRPMENESPECRNCKACPYRTTCWKL